MFISNKTKIILVLTNLIIGTMVPCTSKMITMQVINQGGRLKTFFHPYMQTFMLFFAQALFLIPYFIYKKVYKTQYIMELEQAKQEGKTKVPIRLIAIPAICDFFSSVAQYSAINFIPPSIFQMLKGGAIITTFLFMHLLIKNPIKRSQVTGCIFAVVGVIVVGLAAIIFNPADNYTKTSMIIGCCLIMVPVVMNGFYFSYQQKLMNNYYLPPSLLIGMQGVFGMTFSAITISILTFIPCHLIQKSCVYSQNGLPFIERPQQYFKQLGEYPIVLLLSLILMLVTATFAYTGLRITKYINSVSRIITNISKIILIWTIGIILTVTIGKHNSSYQWQIIQWQIILVQIIGFVFLVFSMLIYNEIIYVPYLTQPKIIPQERQSLITQYN